MGNKNYNYWKRKRFGALDVPYNKLYESIIVDSSISMGAKVLFTDILNLCNNRGKCCTASNYYFAKRYKVGVDTIKAWIKQLKDAAYITSKGRRERKIYANMQTVRDSYAYGVKTTSKESEPIGVEIWPNENTDKKSSGNIDSKGEDAKE
jgi:hypothetical protein